MVDLKSMTPKERREYIWDYYKIHIIGGLIGILLIGSFIYGQVTRVETIFNLTLMGSASIEPKREELQKDITSLLISPTEKKKEAFISTMPIAGNLTSSDASNMQLIQKFMAQIAANELDLIVMDKNDFNKFSEEGIFSKLEDLTDFKSTEFKTQKLVKNSAGDSNYGVDVESNKKLEEIGFNTKDKVIAVIATSNRKDQAVKVLKWLLTE
ncbi:hypothetical protein NBE98_21135 [Clostridium swellfunianum]|uniref:hypothetical protein n=1 Tax=Clostridium swellfunianum TaxID=1367462 RepID=UPI00202F4C1D|nr:hypothetical protein [Clostridium swellfunianum]MCM0650864.1 hypothetical protein [Clostridium swellfunianum]